MSESEIIGKNFSDMLDISNRFHAEFINADRKSLSEGMTVKSRNSMQFPDGEKRFVESIRTPVTLKKGGAVGLVCIYRDLSEVNDTLKASEAISLELKKKDKELQEQSLKLAKVEAALQKAKKAAFCSNGLKQIAAMGAALSDDDYKLYSSYVSVIRNDSAGMGANDLWSRATSLIDAVNRSDTEFVKENHADFISALSRLLAELDKETRGVE
jgi:hypothetical protein